MGKNRSQGFIKGAFIIAAANIIVKIIGAFYKIPLRRYILGPDGMGIYNTSYSIYNVLFIVATAGIPVAISKMISENIAKENYCEVKRIYSVSKIMLSLVGLAGAMIMFFGAGVFANNLKASSARLAIMALSPSLFFASLSSVYRGFNQGMSNMVPTAVSEVVESAGKLVLGLLIASFFLPYGKPVAAAGAILGVSTGTFLSTLFLWSYNRGNKKHINEKIKEYGEKKASESKVVLKRLLSLAIPITLGSSVFTLATLIDLTMIMSQLAKIGYSEETRVTLYGLYSTDAVALFNMPSAIITSVSVSIVPFVSSALAVNRIDDARKTICTAVRTTLLIAIPCAVGMSILSAPILNFVMGDSDASHLLAVLSYGIIFISIVMITNAVLQSMGKEWLPVIHMCIGGAVKIIVNYILVGNPKFNINGAPVGTDLCYLVTAALNLISIQREIHPSYGVKFIIKTIFSSVVMGGICYTVYNVILNVGIKYEFALIISILAAVFVYGFMIIFLKTIRKEDIQTMPGSEKIVKLLGRFL